jgi:acyl-coenzyme A synthetase/AMP-(fatty) acid ligase
MYVPPPIVLALGKHPVIAKYDLSSLRWINSAAAPLSRELAVAVWERLKVGVKQGYGLSETSPAVMLQLPEEWWKFQGSVGRLYPSMEAKIVDEDGTELGYNQVRTITYLEDRVPMLYCRYADDSGILVRRASPQGTKRLLRVLEATRAEQGHLHRGRLVQDGRHLLLLS